MCLLLSSHKQNTPLQVSLLKSVKKSMHDSVGLSSVSRRPGASRGRESSSVSLRMSVFFQGCSRQGMRGKRQALRAALYVGSCPILSGWISGIAQLIDCPCGAMKVNQAPAVGLFAFPHYCFLFLVEIFYLGGRMREKVEGMFSILRH